MKLFVDIAQIAVGVCALFSLCISLRLFHSRHERKRKKKLKRKRPSLDATLQDVHYDKTPPFHHGDVTLELKFKPAREACYFEQIEIHGAKFLTTHYSTKLLQSVVRDDRPDMVPSLLEECPTSRVLEGSWLLPFRKEDDPEDLVFSSIFTIRDVKATLDREMSLSILLRDGARNLKAIITIKSMNACITAITITNDSKKFPIEERLRIWFFKKGLIPCHFGKD